MITANSNLREHDLALLEEAKMARRQMSVPASLMLIVGGGAVEYYVLHSHGWSLTGAVPWHELFQQLSVIGRMLVVAGLIASAWGTGALVNALVRKPE